MTNIVREFDTPITAESLPTRTATDADAMVLVPDSVEHQAGDGLTAGLPPSMETPDIFDNSPQAVVETQTSDQDLVNAQRVELEPKATQAANQVALGQAVQGENDSVATLTTLSDGSVDISRHE